MDGMYFARRSRPFQFGITTLADVLLGGWFGASAFLRKAEARSASASAGHRDREQDREEKDERKSLNKPPEDDQERFHRGSFRKVRPKPDRPPHFHPARCPYHFKLCRKFSALRLGGLGPDGAVREP